MVDNNSKFSWKTERNSSYKILAIEGIPNFGEDLDAMLINQAKCVVGFTSNLLAELKKRLKISIFLWRKSCASR